MEKFKTVNQMMNFLREEDYKFEYKYKDGTYVYWNYDGKAYVVNFDAKTIGDDNMEVVKECERCGEKIEGERFGLFDALCKTCEELAFENDEEYWG